MQHEFYSLLSNAGAGVTGSAVSVLLGGEYMATCSGTSLDGSHTASIQTIDSGGNWVNVYSFTAAGVQTLILKPGSYRGVTTATAPTAVFLEITRAPVC